MKKQKVILVFSYILISFVVFGLRYFEKQTGFFKSLDPNVLFTVVLVALIVTLRLLKRKYKKKNGIPVDDEFSLSIKYKIGYYSYLASSFLWYALFVFKDHFPDIETILGGGIILSALILIITSIIVKRFPDEQ